MKDFNIEGKKVLVRVDFDTPLDENGNIVDDTRIRICIPTIRYILDQNPEQLILMWKLDRPGDKEERLRTDKTAERLEKLLNEKIVKVDGWGEDGLPGDKIAALENMRFNHREQGNKANKDDFAKHLASLGDIYINDAFAMIHRKDASVYNIAKFIPGGIGLNLMKELEKIKEITNNPKRPFTVILGGMKSDKIDSINNLIGKADKILVGGILANTFLKKQGHSIGLSPYFHEKLAHTGEILKNHREKISLPEDVVISVNDSAKRVNVNEIPEEGEILDIGGKTIEKYNNIIKDSNTIYWAGPMGVFEEEKFEDGTKKIAKKLALSNENILIGGGDTSSALDKFDLSDKMTFVSSGGGASLRLVEGKKLPALEILKEDNNIKEG